MPPRSRTPRKPGPVDIEVLRTRLAAGGRVRIGIRASGQFPDGAVGMVRRIGDPMTDGADFVQVETSIGGVKDILPFAPADLLAPPARGAAAAVPSSARTAPSSGGSVGRGSAGNTAAGNTAAGNVAAGSAAGAAAGSAAAGRARSGTAGVPSPPSVLSRAGRASRGLTVPAPDIPMRSRSPIAGSAFAMPRAAEPSKATVPGRSKSGATTGRARPRRIPATVTIATTEDDTAPWTVEARIGARVCLKATPVSPARVWEIVKTLGEPRLTALVDSLLAEHRKATQARADALARELAAVRAELRAYPDADS